MNLQNINKSSTNLIQSIKDKLFNIEMTDFKAQQNIHTRKAVVLDYCLLDGTGLNINSSLIELKWSYCHWWKPAWSQYKLAYMG
jgi:hypothetical protein